MSTSVTSAISPVVTGSGRMKSTTYTATRVTGPTGNPPTYKTEIIRYDDAKGSNQTIIGSRDPETGKIDWNDNASGKTKQNSSAFENASSGQIKSVEGGITSNAAEVAALNKSSGKGNQAQGSGNNQSTPTTAGGRSAMEGTRTSFPGKGGNGPLVYPVALESIDRDLIKFSMMEYRPSKAQASGKRQEGNIIGQVLLPIPGGISDSNNVQWGSGELNPLEMAAAQAGIAALQEDFASGISKFGDNISNVMNDPQVQKGFQAQIVGAATGINQQALQRGEGMVMNPNMELLFGGPTMRSFGFTFKLSPRSKKEAETVIKIMRFFKQGMAVIRSQSQYFLKAPHTFKLEYIKKTTRDSQEVHPYLNRFKECALSSCTVQYTPDGNYNTYSDGVMTSYSMQLGFNELEPVFNDDYSKLDGDSDTMIGY